MFAPRSRRGLAACATLLLLLPTAGSAPLDPFVASGEYAAARALAADCSRPFLPVLDSLDRLAMADDPEWGDDEDADRAGDWTDGRPRGGPSAASGLARWVTSRGATEARDRRAGAARAYHYRTYAAAGDAFAPHLEQAFAGVRSVPLPAGGRIDSYTPDLKTVVTVTSVPTAAGCKRVVIKHPSVVQVGQSFGAVWLVRRFLEKYEKHNRLNNRTGFPTLNKGNASQWNQNVPTIDADTIFIPVTLKVYVDGEPKANQQVKLWTDARGVPCCGYRTIAHQHIVLGRANEAWVPSSLDLRDYNQPATAAERQSRAAAMARSRRRSGIGPSSPITMTTDAQGETPVALFSPGYRGGPEAFVATLADDPSVTALSNIMIANLDAGGGLPFGHFADGMAVDGKRPETASDAFPFNLVGNYSNVHGFGHFVQRTRLKDFQLMWRSVWADDIKARLPNEKHYLTLNQMSFEYGGVTNMGRSATCNSMVASRYSHSYGIDFDMNPCYGGGPRGTDIISGNECLATKGTARNPHLNDDILVKYVLRRGGVIFEHVPPDKTPHHYHIRFPYRAPRGTAEALAG